MSVISMQAVLSPEFRKAKRVWVLACKASRYVQESTKTDIKFYISRRIVCVFHKSRPLNHILCHLNPFHTVVHYLCGCLNL